MPLDNADFGFAADRPDANAVNAGKIYVSTDSGAVELSDGTAWLSVSFDPTGYATETYVDDADDVVLAASRGVHLPHYVVSGQEYSLALSASNTFVGGGPASSGDVYMSAFVPKIDFVSDQMAVNVTTSDAAGTFRLAVYDDDGSLHPGNKIAESGTILGSSIGNKTWAATNTFLAGETYWLGVHIGVGGSMVIERYIGERYMGIGSVFAAGAYSNMNAWFANVAFGAGSPAVFPAGSMVYTNILPIIRMRAA